jgi:hypothetical protein
VRFRLMTLGHRQPRFSQCDGRLVPPGHGNTICWLTLQLRYRGLFGDQED